MRRCNLLAFCEPLQKLRFCHAQQGFLLPDLICRVGCNTCQPTTELILFTAPGFGVQMHWAVLPLVVALPAIVHCMQNSAAFRLLSLLLCHKRHPPVHHDMTLLWLLILVGLLQAARAVSGIRQVAVMMYMQKCQVSFYMLHMQRQYTGRLLPVPPSGNMATFCAGQCVVTLKSSQACFLTARSAGVASERGW